MRFVAENLAGLPYKTFEEVFCVIGSADGILGVTGESTLKWIEDLNEKSEICEDEGVCAGIFGLLSSSCLDSLTQSFDF